MALLTVIITIISLPAALFLWTAHALALNREKVKAIGLPYVVRWISPINPFWLLYGSSFVRLCTRLGIATENMQHIYSYGWEANERARIHLKHGDVFVLVHPGGISLSVANAETIYDILRRRTDFRRNMEEMAVLNVYGKNLSTTDDQEWQQHRKMTGVTFTEKNNEVVWIQSVKQATGMLEYWSQKEEQPIRSTHDDTKVFTLNVLAAALFNNVYHFEGFAEAKKENHKDDPSYQYRESLSTILSSIIQIFIFGEDGLKAWWTPVSWKDAANAMSTFRLYIHGLMDEERTLLRQGANVNQHLVARLVRACEDGRIADDGAPDELPEDAEKPGRNINLTEEEILSNLFVYAFAGNDTTSIALTNLLVHLAANPETQDWIAEEINHYLPHEVTERWSYNNFQKMKRCGAVIMESLRMCHPLSQLVKTTGSSSQILNVDGTQYKIPASTAVHCSLPALHSHPKYWGSTAMEWNPSRFISIDGTENVSSVNTFEEERLAADTSQHFMPFAWGQRVCPGKRFAQVELVAALVVFFKNYRVILEVNDGETEHQARKRAWNTSLKVDHEGHMLHEMVKPESIGLKWVKKV
ncbi:Cytochrome P450 [Glarea lozoyensis ATCC 20868]|uniref:Cytochrome P450 n=1 Tax=Glarea lozoyensis (strain ATCC 20868 / MF5171) TaxID=1116229 RepID=S3D889_GLAL2|nr:Cytochrome P450 [Glarea lozoyensis ATCC 20868]EPE28221.1 Cytochrome P450 [Glarea lozoyensis ATCC 20868]